MFKIERKLASEPDSAYVQVATVAQNIITYSDEGLATVTSYSYRVKASNSAGESAYTNVISATTLAQLPDTPMNLKATVNSFSQITLTWNDIEHEESYEIWRRTAAETQKSHM